MYRSSYRFIYNLCSLEGAGRRYPIMKKEKEIKISYREVNILINALHMLKGFIKENYSGKRRISQIVKIDDLKLKLGELRRWTQTKT